MRRTSLLLKQGVLAAALWAAATPAVLAQAPVTSEARQFSPSLADDDQRNRLPVITSLALSADGKTLATAGDDQIVRLWNMENGKVRSPLAKHRDWVRTLAFSPDGKTLATGGDDRVVRLWDVATGEVKKEMTEATRPIYSLQYSPDGSRLVAVGFEPGMRVYDGHTGELIGNPGCPCSDMRAVAFHPNGHQLACAGRNGKLRLMDVTGGSPPKDVPQAHTRRIRALSFSPDGMLASASEDGRVKIWDPADGKEVREFRAGASKVLSLLFYAPNRLATGGSDNVIRLWDAGTGEELRALKGHTGSVSALTSDRDGTLLISGGYDTTIRVWPLVEHSQSDATAQNQQGDKKTQ